jgi:hypothetical protein
MAELRGAPGYSYATTPHPVAVLTPDQVKERAAQESPWPPFATDGGLPAGTSAVSATLLRTCEFVDNRHTPDPEHVLNDIADTISRTGALIFNDTSAGVVRCPLDGGAGLRRMVGHRLPA